MFECNTPTLRWIEKCQQVFLKLVLKLKKSTNNIDIDSLETKNFQTWKLIIAKISLTVASTEKLKR